MKVTKVKLLCTLALISSANLFFANKTSVYPEGFKPKATTGISFTENKGQVHDQNYKPRPDVLFGAMAGNMAFHLKTTGVSYQLTRVDSYKEVEDSHASTSSASGTKRKEIDKQTIYRIDLSWLNANKNFVTTTDKTFEGYNNYYTEGCPEGGALNVKSYSGVTLHNLYNGINLHYYEKEGQLKHDYIVAPGANYKQIQLKVDGASVSINKDGSLTLNTPLGKVQEGAPIVYQNGKQLKAKWVVNKTAPEANRRLSFDIENYNPNQELIIDPVTRAWGTYYGGAGTEDGRSCATDATGNVYLTGMTIASSQIATAGAHQTVFGGNSNTDAFLVKFNSSGIRQWGTYYGGIGDDFGVCCVTDAIGNVYLTGSTTSSIGTVIATAGAHQTVFGGGLYDDAFLAKFNSNGVRQWGTYVGGNGFDVGLSCTTDALGNVYLTGSTLSSTGTVIATAGAHQTVFSGGNSSTDAFLVKFNSSGVRQWGTYYGTGGDDEGRACATDAAGNVYLSGLTSNNAGTVIATAGAHQTVFAGGTDAFLVKFNSSGVRQWGTYYGGIGSDAGNSCATDALGNVYMAGYTHSSVGTIIATAGAHQTANGGAYDGFLVQFNANGVRQWGTYYGGGGNDVGNSCATDGMGNVYVAGFTDQGTGTVIATTGTPQDVYGGVADAFLAKFNSSGVRQWGTYYGGNDEEQGYSCAINSAGNVYLSGQTLSNTTTAIATAGAHQPVKWSAYDAFLVKFVDCNGAPANATGTDVAICANNSATLTATSAGANINWFASPTSTLVLATGNVYTTPILSTGTYTYYAEAFTCTTSIARTPISVTVTLNASPTITVNSGAICAGNSFTINPSGANTYTIQGGGAIKTPTATTSYTVVGTSTAGCVSSSFATSNVTVNPNPIVLAVSNSSLICTGQSASLTASGANTYTWNTSSTNTVIVISPTITTTYTVNGTDANGCQNSSTITQSVSACTGLAEVNLIESHLLIYPNPFSDIITIETKSFNKTIVIYSVLGENIKSIQLDNEKTKIDLSELSSGIYFIKTEFKTIKIIKQ